MVRQSAFEINWPLTRGGASTVGIWLIIPWGAYYALTILPVPRIQKAIYILHLNLSIVFKGYLCCKPNLTHFEIIILNYLLTTYQNSIDLKRKWTLFAWKENTCLKEKKMKGYDVIILLNIHSCLQEMQNSF